MQGKLKALIAAQAVAVAGILAYRAAAGHQHVLWFSLVLFGIITILAETLGDRGEGGTKTTYGLIPLIGAIVALNGITAMLVALFGAVSLRSDTHRDPWRMAFNGLQYAVSVAAASFIYYAVGGNHQSFTLSQGFKAIPLILLATLAFYTVNTLQVAIVSSWERNRPLQAFYTRPVLVMIANQLIYALVGLVAGIIYAQNAFHIDPVSGIAGTWGEAVRGAAGLGAFLVLLAAAWYFSGRNLKLRKAYDRGVGAVVRYVERREPYLEGHAERVAALTAMTGKHLKMNAYDVNRLYYAALLHDIGKSVVPLQVLAKRGQLSEEEFELVKRHPLESAQHVEAIDFLQGQAESIQHHHEQYDGGGYIDGLAAETIPLGARIMALADAYDAMVSPRPWRGAKSHEEAVAEIRQGAGVLYDEAVTTAFLAALDEVRGQADSVPETEPEEDLELEQISILGPRLKERTDSLKASRMTRHESKTERRRRELRERRQMRESAERQFMAEEGVLPPSETEAEEPLWEPPPAAPPEPPAPPAPPAPQASPPPAPPGRRADTEITGPMPKQSFPNNEEEVPPAYREDDEGGSHGR